MLVSQLSHSSWHGFTFYDLIFPLFIFITGVSVVLSLRKRVERGDDRKVLLQHIIKRSVILFLLGVVYNGISFHRPILQSIRVMGVLQRIAICYFFASLLVIYTKPRTQGAVVLGILAGYWAIMRFIPVPGYGTGVWSIEGNLAHYIDKLFLPGRLYYGTWDPEGLLSTIPAIATCLLGSLTGHWFRVEELKGKPLSPERRAGYLLAAALVLIGLGLLVSLVFPINKKLWTSSYVLLAGGLSVLLLTAFYWVIDLRGLKKWSFPFVVVGMNSIFIYLAAHFIPFDRLANWVGSRLTFLGRTQNLFMGLLVLGLEWLMLYLLYKRKIFIRI